MLAELDYLAFDPELVTDRQNAKQACHEYNQLAPIDADRKAEILKRLLGTMYEVIIEPNFFCDYGYNIHLGRNFYANHNCVILDCAPVIVGDNVMFGPNVTLSTAGHPLDIKTRNSGLEFARTITIGNNVWLGANVTVNPGVTIGDGAVVGSGSVVTRNIPANSVAVGAPCRVIRAIEQAA